MTTSAYIDWNVTARMDDAVRPRVHRGPRDQRLVPARPEPVGRLRDGRGGPPEADRADRLRDDAGPAADAPRQPRRRHPVRRPGRADDPGRQRPGPGPAAHRRPACASRGCPARRSPTSPPLLDAGQQGDQAPLARVRHLRLHQRARLGAVARPAQPAPRGPGHPAGRPARGASCPTSVRSSSRTPRPASSCYVDTGDPGFRRRFEAAARRPARRRSPTAFRRAGVDAVALSTDEDLVAAIVRMATIRRRRRRR